MVINYSSWKKPQNNKTKTEEKAFRVEESL